MLNCFQLLAIKIAVSTGQVLTQLRVNSKKKKKKRDNSN